MSDNIDNELIDLCSTYIDDKDCNYLAKEGQIVQYMSITGRKSEYMWHKHTINEVLRMIRAIRLTTDQAKELREHHLISAFQEAGKVYEFGVKTRHATAEGIFNYSQHSEMSLGDEAMSLLVESLQLQGFTALLMGEIVELYNRVNDKLKLKLTATEQRDLMFKHFEGAGYVMKTGAHRPLIHGKKQPAIMMVGCKPAEVINIPTTVYNNLIAKVYGELI
tara:strand:+ start:1689 stop:2348 length:660 start_codon:yes stop_codon:yes gene_type:complete